MVTQMGLKPKLLLNTHVHADHITCVKGNYEIVSYISYLLEITCRSERNQFQSFVVYRVLYSALRDIGFHVSHEINTWNKLELVLRHHPLYSCRIRHDSNRTWNPPPLAILAAPQNTTIHLHFRALHQRHGKTQEDASGHEKRAVGGVGREGRRQILRRRQDSVWVKVSVCPDWIACRGEERTVLLSCVGCWRHESC